MSTPRQLIARTAIASLVVAVAASESFAQDNISYSARLDNLQTRFFSGTFARSVAVAGDTVAIGHVTGTVEGSNQQGVVWVYVRPAQGWGANPSWSARLRPPDTASEFGHAVAISGDVIFVSSVRANIPPSFDRTNGAVFVYVKPASGWSGTLLPTATLRPRRTNRRLLDDEFGQTLAVRDDLVVVGSTLRAIHNGVDANGSVFVFHKPTAGWSGTINEIGRLDPRPRGLFGPYFLGAQITVGPKTIAVLSQYRGSGIPDVFHYVDLYSRSAGTGWRLPRLPIASVAIPWPASVSGLAIGGETLYVGEFTPSRVQIFEKPPGGWVDTTDDSAVATLLPPDLPNLESFGVGLAARGPNVFVSSSQAANGEWVGRSVHHFKRPAGGWAGYVLSSGDLVPPGGVDPNTGAYGSAVAYDGRTIVVGEPVLARDFVFWGAAHVFERAAPATPLR